MDKQNYLRLIKKYEEDYEIEKLCDLSDELRAKINHSMDYSSNFVTNQYVEVMNLISSTLNKFNAEYAKKTGTKPVVIPIAPYLSTGGGAYTSQITQKDIMDAKTAVTSGWAPGGAFRPGGTFNRGK